MLKNFIKKSLAGALVFCMASTTMMSWTHIAQAKQTFILNDNFESETVDSAPSNWELQDSRMGTLEVKEEDGNKFLRLTSSGNMNPVATTKDTMLPTNFSGTEKLVLKIKIRSSNVSKRATVRLGGSLEDCADPVENKFSVLSVRTSGGAPILQYAKSLYSNGSQEFGAVSSLTTENNKWYDAVIEIVPSTRVITYLITDEEGNEYTASGQLASTTFGSIDEITRIVFESRDTAQGHTIDIDNVQFYRVFESGMTAELLSDEGYIANNADIKIRFSKSVDTDTLTDSTVVLKDKNGETVTCTERSYDEKTRTYTLTPDENLIESEEYTIELAAGIYAGNAGAIGDDIYDNGILTGEKSFSFTVTRGKSSNAYISSITVNGEAIVGFDKTVSEYTVDIPYEDNLTMPVVEAISEDGYAEEPTISYPDGDVDGATVTITSVAEDGVTQLVYKVTFNVVGEELAKLGTNLLINPDFETGTTTGYSITPAEWTGFSVVSGEKHSGSYGAMISGREETSSYFYKNTVSVKPNRTYLLSGWFKVRNSDADDASFEIYPVGSCNRPYRNEESVKGSSSEWRRIILTAETTAQTGSLSPTIISWSNLGDYYVDDLYVGELKPVFNYKGVKKVLVPESGNKEVELKTDIVNQFGTKNGLPNASVTQWEIVGNSYGTYIEDGKLVVPASAQAGTVKIKAIYDPDYLGDDLYTDEWSENVEIEIFDDPALFPNAYLSSISVNGTAIQNFDKETMSYTVNIQYEDNLTMPIVTAITEASDAQTPIIEYPDGAVDGATVKIISVAKDGETQFVYTVSFKVVGEELAKLGANLLTNPGFETGTTEGYTVTPATWTGFRAVSGENEMHSGSYGAVISGKEDVESYFYKNSVTVKPRRTYLLAGWFRVKSENDRRKQFEIYPQGSCERPYRNSEYVSASNNEWKLVISTAVTGNVNSSLSPTILSWEQLTGNYYVDDLYVGELKPVFEYKGETEKEISRSANTEIELKADIVNQFGTKNGLPDAVITNWEIVSDSYGIYIQDEKLIITPDAEAGTVEIKATFEPNYLGDDLYTDEWSQTVNILLTDDGDTTPKVKNIILSGTVKTGETLSIADYRYYQLNGDAENGSLFQWLYSDSANGTYLQIPNATDSAYIVGEAYADKFIKVKILPKSQGGLEGVWTESSMYLYKPTAPVATEIKVTPSVSAYGIGDTLTAEYKYFDINGDKETDSTLRWLRYNKETNQYDPITGANERIYTLTADDTDTVLKFEVTPFAENSSVPGSPSLSREINGPATPYVSDVGIVSKSNTLLAVSYKYNHPNGVAEGDTIVKWYIDGAYKGTGMSCTISSSGRKNVRVEITPVASKAPFNGKTTEITKTVEASSGGSGGSGGGGGGGSSAGQIVEIPQPEVPVTPAAPSQPVNHWATEAILWAVSKGYMENTEHNPLIPDEIISREDFLTIILKAVNLQPVEYRNEFKDIADSEFAQLLQAAVDKGIISKYDNFYPNRSVSREEICKIVVIALSVTGADVEKNAELSAYTDSTDVADWAKTYVSQMVGTGIMKGVSSSEFMPKGNVTKAQTAVILQRLENYLNSAETEEK